MKHNLLELYVFFDKNFTLRPFFFAKIVYFSFLDGNTKLKKEHKYLSLLPLYFQHLDKVKDR